MAKKQTSKRTSKKAPAIHKAAIPTNTPLDIKKLSENDLKGLELWAVCPPVPGNPYSFKSAQELWDRSMLYIKWAELNPVETTDFKGGQGKRVTYYKKRPLTIYGLCCFTGQSESYFRHLKATTPEMPVPEDFATKKAYENALQKYNLHCQLVTVYMRVRAVFSAYNADLATSGDVKENIIAKLEGWADKQEIESKVLQQQVFTLNISKPNLDR